MFSGLRGFLGGFWWFSGVLWIFLNFKLCYWVYVCFWGILGGFGALSWWLSFGLCGFVGLGFVCGLLRLSDLGLGVDCVSLGFRVCGLCCFFLFWVLVDDMFGG